jgi:hypothetical protein
VENQNNDAELLNRREAAKYLGVCTTTLDRLKIPKTKIRHRTMYRRDVLKKWVEENTENGKRKK